MRNLRLALGLLTTIPVNLPTDLSAGDSGRAAVWYPLVGLVIGALTWLSWTAAMAVFPPLVGAALALAVWVVLTGGLHLDGLADCCDGLLVSAAKKRRLEIMKDPHIGTFGVIGLVLVLFVKAATLASLQPVSSLASCSREVWHAGVSCRRGCFRLHETQVWAQISCWAFGGLISPGGW